MGDFKNIEANRLTGPDLALCLRDFFLCETGADFDAFFRLYHGEKSNPELEYEFNRLFTGPTAPVAPPYASVYLEKEPRLMGESTLQIRQLYRALGLAVPDGRPDDFIAYELEAWLILSEMEGPEARAAIGWLEKHMSSWLGQFLAKLRGADLSTQMAGIADMLEGWLKRLDSGNKESSNC